MLPNHWFNSGVNGARGGGNEDQEDICCPTIGLTVVLTERGMVENEDQQDIDR